MDLPITLRPWAETLSLFTDEIALALGPAIRRLAEAVGPLYSGEPHAGGEPEGFDGLARRGSYEHLLCAEWLLAESWPNEFMRRAAMGEHLFLRRAFQRPSQGRTSAVLFDAGPDQVGRPRIAQLALLILLQRRARLANADFAWGILQRPEDGLHAELDEAGIKRFLESRSWHVVSAAHMTEWRGLLGSIEDVWLAGGPRVPGGLDTPRWVRILDDEEEAHTRRLLVTVHRSGTTNELALALPEEDLCGDILYLPFLKQKSRSNRPFEGTRSFFVHPMVSRMIVFLADGDALILGIPSGPTDSQCSIKRFETPPGHRLVAAGFHKRYNLFLTLNKGLLTCFGLPPILTMEPFTATVGEWEPKTGKLLPMYFMSYYILVPDFAGNLIRLAPSHKLTVVDSHLVCTAKIDKTLIWLKRESQRGHALVCDPGGGSFRHELEVKMEKPSIFFGKGSWDTSLTGLVLIHQHGLTWRLNYRSISRLIQVPEDQQVVGVTYYPGGALRLPGLNQTPVLILLDRRKRRLSLYNEGDQYSITESKSPIREIFVHPYGSRIIWSTLGGDLVVYSLRHMAAVFFYPKEAPR